MNTTITEHTIDATGKRLGIVATEAAKILIGKTSPEFTRHIAAPMRVTITNVSKLDIPEKKQGEIYQNFTGYPGGRKTETLGHLAHRRGYAEVVKRTVAGMLPSNKLKKIRLAQLTITE